MKNMTEESRRNFMRAYDQLRAEKNAERSSESRKNLMRAADTYRASHAQRDDEELPTETREKLARAHNWLRNQRNQHRDDEAGARKLEEMEAADPSLTPLLVHIVGEFMRSKSLPR